MVNKIITDLIQVAIEAKAHYQVWWAIEHDGVKSFAKCINRFPDFFEATRVAHFRSMVMAAWKPFDKKGKVSSFKNLIKCNPAFLSELDIESIKNHLAKRDIIDGVEKIRHLFVAHQNAGLSTEQIFDLAKITPNNLKDLIYQTGDLVNHISRKCGIRNGVFESNRGFDSTIRLLTALQI